ncbi:MAG: TRAP transporter small permease [Betaproteobacteria bacterium]
MQQPSIGSADELAAQRGTYGRALAATAKWFAYGGGLVFVGLVAMSIVSIVGRKLVGIPVPGDVEVLQMLAAVASASFFAQCHLHHGDVKVDFFTAWLSREGRGFLDTVGSSLVGVVGALLAWRTLAGAISLREAGEVSAILGWPVWLAQLSMVPSFALLALAGFYMAQQYWAQRKGRT